MIVSRNSIVAGMLYIKRLTESCREHYMYSSFAPSGMGYPMHGRGVREAMK
jgi:hypothetical protein